jgi:hypothetical protein
MFDLAIPPGFFKEALNMEITRKGALAPRQGMDKLSETPDGNPIINLETFDWNGTDRTFVATREHVYEFSFDVSGDPEWTELYEYTVLCSKITFALFNASTSPFLLFGNGKSLIIEYDGTGIDVLPPDSPEGFPFEYMNYIVVWGMEDNPGRVQFSALPGDTSAWDNGGVPITIETEGTVTGLANFVGLVIFSGRKARIFHGDPQAPQGLMSLSDTIGCVEQKTVAEAEGILLWMSYNGIAFWNGSGMFPTGFLSEREGERLSNISEEMLRVAWSMSKQFCTHYQFDTRQLFVSLKIIPPDYGPRESRTYVFDLKRQAWMPWDLEAPAMTMLVANIKHTIGEETVSTPRKLLLIGTEDGTLGILGEGAPQVLLRDETVTGEREYDFFATTSTFDFGDSTVNKIYRAVMARLWRQNTPGMDGIRRVNISLNGDFKTQSVDDASLRCPFDFVLGLSQMGDPLGINYPTEVGQPVALRSKYLSITVHGKGNINGVVIDAIGLSVKPRSKRRGLIQQNNLRWQR